MIFSEVLTLAVSLRDKHPFLLQSIQGRSSRFCLPCNVS